MLLGLAEHVDLYRLAAAGRKVEGRIALSRFLRFSASVAEAKGDVEVWLQFGRREDGVSYLRGKLHAEVAVICQRCMQPMRLPLEANVNLGFVRGDAEEEQLSSDLEPLRVDSEQMDLADILEDELLLSLPIIAMHPEDVCALRVSSDVETDVPEQEMDGKTNPFAVLAGLKTEK